MKEATVSERWKIYRVLIIYRNLWSLVSLAHFMAPGCFFDGHIFNGHIIDGHFFDQ